MSKENFFTHLEAFRKMLLEVLAIFMVLLIAAFFFTPGLLAFLQRQAAGTAEEAFPLHYFALMEPFAVELKAALLLALGFGMPLYFWRFWRFLAPALYPGERRWIAGGALAALALFWSGALLALFGVMPIMIRFAMGFARDGLTPLIGMENFVMLQLTVCIAFGVMFELPLVILLLAALGVVPMETLRRQRGMVLVVLLFVSALLTPPDVVSQILLALPCYLLFELTLLAAHFLVRRRAAEESAHEVLVLREPESPAAEPERKSVRKPRKRIRPADRVGRR